MQVKILDAPVKIGSKASFMGVLRSDELKDDPKLEACPSKPTAHLMIGTPPGPHILKIQSALGRLRAPGPAISATEKSAMAYGPTTAATVLSYRQTDVPPMITNGGRI